MDIFDYSDYRAFLRDWYQERKAANPKFSYRLLAKKVGFKSAGFFTLILQGKTNISLEVVEGFSEALKLKKSEKDFFRLLVLHNQAKENDRRLELWKKLSSLQAVQTKRLSPNLYRFMEKWYHIAIRELIAIIRFRGDYAELGRLLEPSITAQEAESAIKMLLELGMIRKNAQGYYEKVDAILTVGNEAKGPLVEDFFLAMHKLGGEALQRFPRGQRNLSWLTLSISGERYLEIVEELRQFRRKLLQAAEADPDPEAVFQLNFEIFPLTAFPESAAKALAAKVLSENAPAAKAQSATARAGAVTATPKSGAATLAAHRSNPDAP